MNPTPYNHGGLLIGRIHRRRSPQYAHGYEGHIPMKRSRSIFRYLWRLCVAAVLFVFIAAWLLHRVHVI